MPNAPNDKSSDDSACCSPPAPEKPHPSPNAAQSRVKKSPPSHTRKSAPSRRMLRRIPPPIAHVAGIKLLQVQPVHHLADEIDQVVWRQPFTHGGRQQKVLVRLIRTKRRGHNTQKVSKAARIYASGAKIAGESAPIPPRSEVSVAQTPSQMFYGFAGFRIHPRCRTAAGPEGYLNLTKCPDCVAFPVDEVMIKRYT